ncbi:MAG: T9SS type A sorting domain-containing protein [Chitinophagales bacterium]|nr:T9SS type A sorting domain-containing protein [Chitinophagales bacterium]
MKKAILILFAALSVSSAYAQCEGGRYINKIFSQTIRTKDIAYTNARNAAGTMQNVMMDVFEPKNDTAALRPLVIFEHGGAYWTGTKDYESQIAMGEEFAKRGYVVSSATYRLEPSPLSLLFQDLMIKAVGRGVQDTKELVRYFFNSARDSANPFRIDTSKIFLCGASAGAFNVLHAVYLDSLDILDAQWKNSLEGIGGVFGRYDFIDFGKKIFGVVNINGALGDKSFLDNEHTNFLSVHNWWDPEVPFNRGQPYSIPTLMYVDGSNILHTKAQQLGIYNPFYIIPDWGHTSYSTDLFGQVTQPYFDSTVWYMKNFFAYQLGCPNITTGIKNNTAVKDLKAYPNPTLNDIYFDGVQQYFGQQISVTDIAGREVYHALFDGKPVSTQSIGLTKGIYLVRLTNEKTQESAVGKIVVD